MSDTTQTCPQTHARAAGITLLDILGCAIFSMMHVPSTLIVPGDAAATAANIQASEPLFRMALASDAILFLAEIVLTVLLYVLLKPVSKTLALVATFARLAMTVMQGVNVVVNFTALLLLGGAGYLTVFEPDQLNALVLLLMEAHTCGELVWGAFFGLHCVVLAWLIYKSGYLPKVLGILMAVAAFGYLADSFGNLLSAGYDARFAWLVSVTGFAGEMPFFLWLLIKGVDVPKWHGRVAAASQG
jgi:hypothetical protein